MLPRHSLVGAVGLGGGGGGIRCHVHPLRSPAGIAAVGPQRYPPVHAGAQSARGLEPSEMLLKDLAVYVRLLGGWRVVRKALGGMR
eukprot:ctg_167.g108